jgi:hypothetical protein
MMAQLDWKTRHPFTVGQTVYGRQVPALESFGMFIAAGKAYTVVMRGEDAHGAWISVIGVCEHLPVRIFTADAPVVNEVA